MDNYDIFNRVFSKSNLTSFLNSEYSSSFINSVTRIVSDPENKTNEKVISEIYQFLSINHRNEYFYKNTLLNQLLVNSKDHNIDTTVAFTELPVSKSKLDFLLINGKAVVYEIKTELDNFERLHSQINDYYKAFDYLYIVTSNSHLARLKENLIQYPTVGIMVLNEDGKINTKKKAKSYKDNLDKKTIFKILRKKEFESILMECYGTLPDVSQFEYYKECLRKFCNIKIEVIYPIFLKILKKRESIIKESFLLVPEELKTLVYFSDLNNKDYNNLEVFLQKSFRR